ncbi:MAG: arginase [Luteibaculaceae bacterium]
MNKEIVFVNIDSELGAGTRGASLGYDALKIAGWNKKSNLLNRFKTVKVATKNDVLFHKTDTPYALRIDTILEVFTGASNAVKETLENNQFPVVIAGDHSVAAATIAGVKMANPNKQLGVVWIDAHADLHTPYTSPSGNLHGMPLAISLAEDNKDYTINPLTNKSKQYWENLKNLGGIAPKIVPENLVFFGVRDTETPEDSLIEKLQIRNFTVEECRYKGLAYCVDKAMQRLGHCDIIHISFDVDSLDSLLISQGTGTPVPFGFTPEEAKEIINCFLQTQKVVCFEMVEINPTLDNKKNLMAETAFDVLENTIKTIEKPVTAAAL